MFPRHRLIESGIALETGHVILIVTSPIQGRVSTLIPLGRSAVATTLAKYNGAKCSIP